MKMFSCLLLALVAAAAGCNKKQPNAAAQLEKSYKQADSAIKEEVQKVSAELQSKDYTQAILAMDRVVSAQQQQSQALTAEQKKAVEAVVGQTRAAVNKNPKLDTPELYKAMSDLILRTYGEN